MLAPTIIFIIFLIGFIYRRDLNPVNKGKSFFYRHRKLIGLFAITIIPIVSINIYIPEVYTVTADDHITYGTRNDIPDEVFQGYRIKKDQYPDSTEIQIKYMDSWMEARSPYTCNWMIDEYAERNRSNSVFCQQYAKYMHCGENLEIHRLDSIDQNQKFVHLLKAMYYRDQNNFKSSESEAVKEIQINPQYPRTYDFLTHLYGRYSGEKLDSLMTDWPSFNKLDHHYRADFYFQNFLPLRYILTYYEWTFLYTGWFSYIASFFVSLVWLIFLWFSRKSERMNWVQIILLFVLAILFADLCHFAYDFARLKLHFGLNGHFMNDLFYLWTVNGGSEELVKLIPWLFFGFVFRKLKDPRNYILLASISALGFAFNENLYYLDDSGNIVVRTIMTAMVHMFCASTVAYAIVLAKFKYKTKKARILFPLAGFAAAALFHGLFNFTIMSASMADFRILHFILFLVYVRFWFYYRDKAAKLANVPTIVGNNERHREFQIDILNFGMVFILMLEFILISLEYGADDGNHVIGSRAMIIGVFLVFVSLIMDGFNFWPSLKKYRFNWSKVGSILPTFSTVEETERHPQEEKLEMTGLALRFFSSKSNPYVGNYFPQKGVCIKRVTVGGDPNWYVCQMEKAQPLKQYHPHLVIVKPIGSRNELDHDKIPVYFMFIPNENLINMPDIPIKKLRTAGKVFSRPINF